MKLVCELEKYVWVKEKKVVGCGYDLRKKKVYFIVNLYLVYVINCKVDEFGIFLYFILVFNIEVIIFINLG